VQERFSRLFPAPRQRWIEALAVDPAALRALPHRVLLIHGRNDEIIPLQSSESLAALLPDARLAIIDRCGHWVQIEHTDRFVSELLEFLEPKSP
jgi:2-hydroxymuconate-semialdehyde hydrolase